jgi:DNA excision repair protein ERCC-3
MSLLDFGPNDHQNMLLKPDHVSRPLWICKEPPGPIPLYRIFLETFSPVYKQAYDFLISIAEPICRPNLIHEYQLTPYSLHAAVSTGLETATIINVLDRLAKNHLPKDLCEFIRSNTAAYGKVKLVLQRNRYFVESAFPDVVERLLKDDLIR